MGDDQFAKFWVTYGARADALARLEKERAAALVYLRVVATPVPTPIPTPRPVPISDATVRFDRGYIDEGGDASLLGHVHLVMACEGSWLADPGNPTYLGTAQFLPSTWASVRRSPQSDWRDFYEVGWAVARLLVVADPYTQWPYCWPHTQ